MKINGVYGTACTVRVNSRQQTAAVLSSRAGRRYRQVRPIRLHRYIPRQFCGKAAAVVGVGIYAVTTGQYRCISGIPVGRWGHSEQCFHECCFDRLTRTNPSLGLCNRHYHVWYCECLYLWTVIEQRTHKIGVFVFQSITFLNQTENQCESFIICQSFFLNTAVYTAISSNVIWSNTLFEGHAIRGAVQLQLKQYSERNCQHFQQRFPFFAHGILLFFCTNYKRCVLSHVAFSTHGKYIQISSSTQCNTKTTTPLSLSNHACLPDDYVICV